MRRCDTVLATLLGILLITASVGAEIEINGTETVGLVTNVVAAETDEPTVSFESTNNTTVTAVEPTNTTESTKIELNTTAEPTNTAAEPTNTTAEATNTTAEPTNTVAEPTNNTAEPTNTTAEPTNTTAEPTNTDAYHRAESAEGGEVYMAARQGQIATKSAAAAGTEAPVEEGATRMPEKTGEPSVGDRPADDCPLKSAGDHPWLIRITPMKLPNKLTRRRNKAWNSNVTQKGKNLDVPSIRFRRGRGEDANDTADGIFDEALTTAGTTGKLPKTIQACKSKMHGSLITPSKVLTTAKYRNDWTTKTPFPENYLSLIGYNNERNCKQEQWGKEAHFQSKSSQYVLNVGDFAVIDTYAPFKVEGEPFLFGGTGHPNFVDTVEIYHKLVSGYEQHADVQVNIHLFRDDSNKDDGETYDAATFQFIPWDECTRNELVKMIEGISPETEPDTFFCGNGNNERSNGTGNVTVEDPSADWFQGAPVIYKEGNTDVPLGHYVYGTGATGDLRIYATFTENLRDLLDHRTPDETDDPSDVKIKPMMTRGDDDRESTGFPAPTVRERARAINVGQGPSSEGLQCHTGSLWIAIAGFANSIRWFG